MGVKVPWHRSEGNGVAFRGGGVLPMVVPAPGTHEPSRRPGETAMQVDPANYKDLKLKLDGIVPPGHGFHRNVLLEALYASLPRDPQVKVQIYNAEIVPGGYTNWHCHNGAAFFVALQGLFEAHFQEGVLVKAKAGDCYSEPIAKFHRGHNPHPELPYLCIGLCFTSPDREHVTNSIERPW
jgi:quercetin dioxygenase-like cupin family protein